MAAQTNFGNGCFAMIGLSALPRELKAMICGYLRDDKRSLRALSLACSSFQEPCQGQLFRVVSFHGSPYNHKTPNFVYHGLHNLLTSSRHLIHHIRHVHIRFHPKDTWYARDGEFLEVLRRLERVSLLEIGTEPDRSFDWSLLGQETSEAFEDVFRQRTLRVVRINGIYNLPAVHLRHLSRTKQLQLSQTKFLVPDLPGSLPSLPLHHGPIDGVLDASPHRLALSHLTPNLLSFVLSPSYPYSIPRLQELDLDAKGISPEVLLDRCSGSLQSLTLYLDEHTPTYKLHELLNLRILNIKVPIDKNYRIPPADSLDRLITTLRTCLELQHRLHHLQIDFLAYGRFVISLPYPQFKTWKILDHTLSHPIFGRVSILYEIKDDDEESADWDLGMMSMCMPSFVRRADQLLFERAIDLSAT